MPPAALLGSYQQYKNDTNVVATWLATTSKALGFSGALTTVDEPSQPSAKQEKPPTGGRLKGKARKEAKKAGSSAEPATSVTAPIPPKHVLAIRDFVPLAQYIATAKKSLGDIPSFFSDALTRVIDARKRFPVELLKLRAPTQATQARESESDRKHAHFVGVLESVQQALSAVFDMSGMKAAADDIAVNQNNTNEQNLNSSNGQKSTSSPNLFAHLEVYEPSEDFLNAPDVTPTASAPNEQTFTMETPDTFTEAVLALTSLLYDTRLIRERIQVLWSEVRSDVSQLRAAAVATNTAIELVRGMEEAITPLLDQHGGAETLFRSIFRLMCRAEGLDPDEHGPTDSYNYACYNIAHDYLYNTYKIFSEVSETYTGSRGTPVYQGQQGWYDETLPRGHKSKQFHQDMLALLELMLDRMHLYEGCKRELIMDDELTGGIKLLNERKIVPMWLAFGAQVHLDTLSVLSTNLDKCVDHFITKLKQFDEMVPDHRAFAHYLDPILRNNIQAFHGLTSLWVQADDPLTQAFRRARPQVKSPKPNRFRKYNPMFCGLLLNLMTVHFHDVANKFSCETTSVLSAVQLLHCMEQEGMLDRNRRHTILEEVQLYQPPSAYFVGDEPPRDAEGYFRTFCITRGMSAANFVTTRRGNTKQMSDAGRRTVRNQAMASRYFSAVAVPGEKETRRFDLKSFQAAIDTIHAVQSVKNVRQGEEAEEGKDTWRARLLKKRVQPKPARSPADLIHQVAMAVEDETPYIELNYFEVFQTAEKMMVQLQPLCDHFFGTRIIPVWGECYLADAVGPIFAALAGKIETKQGDAQSLAKTVASLVLEFHYGLPNGNTGDDVLSREEARRIIEDVTVRANRGGPSAGRR